MKSIRIFALAIFFVLLSTVQVSAASGVFGTGFCLQSLPIISWFVKPEDNPCLNDGEVTVEPAPISQQLKNAFSYMLASLVSDTENIVLSSPTPLKVTSLAETSTSSPASASPTPVSLGYQSYTAGTGIGISGNQITNTGITSLSSGSGISITGNTISNADGGSAQSIFKNIQVANQNTISAGNNNDQLTIIAGTGIALTTDANQKELTITNTVTSGALNGWNSTIGLVSLGDTSNDVVIGSGSSLGKLSVVGTNNETQMVVRGNSTQTSRLLDLQNSSGTSLASFNANGALTIIENQGITLTANTPSTGTISRLITLKATSQYDRPWISSLDHNGRHVAGMGIHGVNFDDSSTHNRWELKTVADAGGSMPNTLLTRFAVDYGTDLANIIFADIDTIGIHNDYGDRIQMVHKMRDSGDTGSFTIGQWITELGAADSTVMTIDPVTLNNTTDATIRWFRETNTSGQRRIVVYRGDGTTTESFVINAGTGAFSVFANAETGRLGDGTNTSSYLNFQSNRTMVGYDGSFAVLQGGTSKGIKFNVNTSSFGAGTVMTIAPTGEVSIADLNVAGGVVYTDSSGLLASIAGNAGECLTSNGSSAPSWATCGGSGSGNWVIGNGAIYPVNSTVDFLVGGTSSASAKFAVVNVNSGTAVASVSGLLTVNNSAARIQGTQYRTLNIGGNMTGTISLQPNNSTGRVGINTSSPLAELDVVHSSSPEFRLSKSATDYFVLEKRSSAGSGIADVTLTGEALLDFDPITTDGVSKSSVRLFRNVTTSDTGTGFTIYAADGTSTVQSFFGAKTNSYFNVNAGNFGVGTSSPIAKLDVEGSASLSGTLSFRGATDPKIDILNSEHFGVRTSPGGTPGVTERFTILNNGNVGIGSTNPGHLIELAGGAFSDGPTWENSSDRNVKTGFAEVDSELILAKIAELPITEWSYISEGMGVRHIGPVAQDFQAVFGLGKYDTSISTIDPAGVALVGIQGLNAKFDRLAAAVDSQKSGQVAGAYDKVVESLPQPSSFSGEVEYLNVLKGLDVRGLVAFFNEVVFKARARFEKAPEFSKDTAGLAVIKTGADRVRITFSERYQQPPQVSASVRTSGANEASVLAQNINYVITDVSDEGFTIRLSRPTAEEVTFSWIALSVAEPRTFVGEEVVSQPETAASPAPTPSQQFVVSPSSAPSPSLLPSPSPDPVITPEPSEAPQASESSEVQ